MANMSYCRFQNTQSDLEDCLEALEETFFDLEELAEDMDEQEARAMRRLIETCKKIAEGAGAMNVNQS